MTEQTPPPRPPTQPRQEYVSSIVTKYGDKERVKQDATVLHDIWKRQGPHLLLDVIAEQTGDVANRFRFVKRQRQNLIDTLLRDFREALEDRL